MNSPNLLGKLTLFSALRESLKGGYTRQRLRDDLLAGITVGIIAIPLAMALAIASGVAPQHGLYTAIIAGFLIPLTGGSRFSVSGPTAAFVVILFPISKQFGLSGLLVATLMAGAMLVLMSLARLGRLIEYIPQPVTLGFTSGIAVVIALLQVKDFFGLPITELPEAFFERLGVLLERLPLFSPAELFVAATTLAVLLLWKRTQIPVPAYLPAVIAGVLASLLIDSDTVATIGSRFSYTLADGSIGFGIPPVLPDLVWPWLQPGPDGLPLQWSVDLLIALLPSAFSIAMLGAIESLLCAVVLDGMSGKRHHSNGELLGQGLGNLVAPLFGGITATAALARSAANFKSGASSPIAACIHALVVLAGILVLAPWLAYIPMASMAAMLVIVAWNMSEAHKVVELFKQAPRGDLLVFTTCFLLTVVVDMVVAISVGVVLASLLFMREIAQMTRVSDISEHPKHVTAPLAPHWGVYKISGPLFFAAADRVFDEVSALSSDKRSIILYMDAVPVLDAGGLSALRKFVDQKIATGCQIVIADLQFQPLKTIARSGLRHPREGLRFSDSLTAALKLADGALTPR